jgi:glycine cleavage system H protein
MSTKYSEDHEWITVKSNIGTVGITDFAQQQIGDVVFVEMPEVGAKLNKGDEAGIVESVKAASEIYSPISGEVIEINGSLEVAPEMVNSDPTGAGWFFKRELSNASELDQLMDEVAYKAFIEE